MIKVVFFDMGGVVVRDTYGSSLITKTLKKYKVNSYKYTKKIQPIGRKLETGRITPSQFSLLIKKLTGLNGSIQFKKDMFSLSLNQFKLNKRVVNLARSLKRKGYVVGMITNTTPFHVYAHKKHNQYKYFHPIITSLYAKSMKPELKIYRIAFKKAKVKPSESIFIDNLPINIAAAKKLGMKGIVYKNPSQLKKDLERLLRLKL